MQDLRYFVPLPPGAVEKGKESSVPGKLELLKVRHQACLCSPLPVLVRPNLKASADASYTQLLWLQTCRVLAHWTPTTFVHE